MAKKIGVAAMGLFVVLFLGINLYLYTVKNNSSSAMSGMAITDLPFGLNISLLAFILQWIILLCIVFFAYTRFLKHRKEEDEKIKFLVIPEPKSKAETNIDILYNFLKKEEGLSIGAVARIFNVKKEVALGWGKILEENDLATIEYPAFADPEIKIKKDEEEQPKTKKIKKEDKK
jgi:hypothetical protein